MEVSEEIRKRYDQLLKWISEGYIYYEKEAKDLVDRYNLPEEPLNKSLIIGAKKTFNEYLEHIRAGDYGYYTHALDLAKRFKFPTTEIKRVLREGKLREFSSYLTKIIKLEGDEEEHAARRIIQELCSNSGMTEEERRGMEKMMYAQLEDAIEKSRLIRKRKEKEDKLKFVKRRRKKK